MQTKTILETHHLIKEFKGFVAVNSVKGLGALKHIGIPV